MPSFLDETGLQRVRDKINGLYKRREELIGTVVWFSGNTGKVPAGYLVCNGQAVSRTTYAGLFAVIGTKYGGGDGSTTFNVPNLSDGNGRFIRAGFSDSAIGSKQGDAIRNITGVIQRADQGSYTSGNRGAWPNIWGCWEDIGYSGCGYANYVSNYKTTVKRFNANADASSYGNPMAGHANASEIRPYNVLMLPLIAY